GLHAIRVESLYPVSAPGQYVIRIAELRSARAGDEDRLAAERDIVDGQRMQNEGHLPEALRRYDDAVARYGRLDDPREEPAALSLAGTGRAMSGDVPAAFET